MRRLRGARGALVSLTCGGLILGWFQAFGSLNFADIFTRVLTQFFSLLIALLLGADPNATNGLNA